MKQKQLLLAALLLFSATLFAQSNPATQAEKDPQRVKDILKINLLSLPLKNVSVQYEYLLKKKISLAFGLRVMPSTAIPFEKQVLNAVGEDDQDTRDLINTSRLANFAFTPEVRFYLGKGYGKGFYIAPYYRFVNVSSNTVTLNYSAANGPKRSVNLSGDLHAHTGGVLLGAQWFLGKHVALDWWILGAHYGTGSGRFDGVPSTPLSPSEQEDVHQTLDNIDVPLVNKTVNVTANNIVVKTTGAFGGLRSGLCLGIRF